MVSPGANIFPHSYNNENECPGVGEYKTTVFAAGCVLPGATVFKVKKMK